MLCRCRSLLTQEGICLTLKPDFHFLEVAYPYIARRAAHRRGPQPCAIASSRRALACNAPSLGNMPDDQIEELWHGGIVRWPQSVAAVPDMLDVKATHAAPVLAQYFEHDEKSTPCLRPWCADALPCLFCIQVLFQGRQISQWRRLYNLIIKLAREGSGGGLDLSDTVADGARVLILDKQAPARRCRGASSWLRALRNRRSREESSYPRLQLMDACIWDDAWRGRRLALVSLSAALGCTTTWLASTAAAALSMPLLCEGVCVCVSSLSWSSPCVVFVL